MMIIHINNDNFIIAFLNYNQDFNKVRNFSFLCLM